MATTPQDQFDSCIFERWDEALEQPSILYNHTNTHTTHTGAFCADVHAECGR